jgi:prolipoprotein diacylglyceryltransferase
VASLGTCDESESQSRPFDFLWAGGSFHGGQHAVVGVITDTRLFSHNGNIKHMKLGDVVSLGLFIGFVFLCRGSIAIDK